MLPGNCNLKLLTILFSGCLFIFQAVAGQHQPISYRASLSTSAATENRLPFWLSTNRFGVVDPAGTGAALQLGAFASNKEEGSISYTWGVDLVGRASPHQSLFFQQFFGELNLGPFLLRAGRKEQTAGMVHPHLSLGSMIVSRNAAPITRISISWPDYVSIPGTDEFVAIKGYLGHGWIDGDRIVRNPFVHEKSFYMRVGGKNWPVHGHGGVMHYAMWAGEHVNPDIGRLPASFNDYLRVFFVQGANPESGEDPEITNVLGNSLGAYDFKLDVDLKNVTLRAYRQFYLEDTVSLAFRNGWDGLWGLSLAFPHKPGGLKNVLYEHVNTKRQSSKSVELEMGLLGTDNYYNHFLYSSGWTHRGRTLGMPLILTSDEVHGVFDNILLGHHFALEGELAQTISYTAFFTYNRNYGTHSILFSDTDVRTRNSRTPARHRYAAMLDLSSTLFPSYDIDGFLRLAYDWGDTPLNNNLGVTIGLVSQLEIAH